LPYGAGHDCSICPFTKYDLSCCFFDRQPTSRFARLLIDYENEHEGDPDARPPSEGECRAPFQKRPIIHVAIKIMRAQAKKKAAAAAKAAKARVSD
jgi:hypothetical protein